MRARAYAVATFYHETCCARRYQPGDKVFPLNDNVTAKTTDIVMLELDTAWSEQRCIVRGPGCPGGIKVAEYLKMFYQFSLPIFPLWQPRISASARGADAPPAICDGSVVDDDDQTELPALCDAAPELPALCDVPQPVSRPPKRARVMQPSGPSLLTSVFVASGYCMLNRASTFQAVPSHHPPCSRGLWFGWNHMPRSSIRSSTGICFWPMKHAPMAYLIFRMDFVVVSIVHEIVRLTLHVSVTIVSV